MPPTGDRLTDAMRRLAAPDEPLPHSVLHLAQCEGQSAIDKRVTLRMVDRDRLMSDSKPVAVWCGVPGASAIVKQGAEMALGFFRGDPTQPFAMLASPFGQPGHVPQSVSYEASTLIEMIAGAESLAAKVNIGGVGAQPVALATLLVAYLNALELWATQIDAQAPNVAALAAQTPALVPPLGGPYFIAVGNRATAALNISQIASLKLESL